MEGDAAKPFEVPSLKQCCINCVIKHRDYLWDVGYVDSDTLRQILSHCSAEQLAHVEDQTKQSSGRDLSWHTWHYWYNHYIIKYRKPGPDVKVPLLPGPAPLDYVAPPSQALPSGPPGDWRAAYENKTKAELQRAEAISNKLRKCYKQEAVDKSNREVKEVAALPQPKRRRLSGGPSMTSPMQRERSSSGASSEGGPKPVKPSLALLKAVKHRGPAALPSQRKVAGVKPSPTNSFARPNIAPARKGPPPPRGNFSSPSPSLQRQSFATPTSTKFPAPQRPGTGPPPGANPRGTSGGGPPGGNQLAPGSSAAKQAALQAAAAAAVAAVRAQQAGPRATHPAAAGNLKRKEEPAMNGKLLGTQLHKKLRQQ